MAGKAFSSWWMPLGAALVLGPIGCARYVGLVLCIAGGSTDQDIVGRAGVAEICGESSVVMMGGMIIGIVLALAAVVAWRKRTTGSAHAAGSGTAPRR